MLPSELHQDTIRRDQDYVNIWNAVIWIVITHMIHAVCSGCVKHVSWSGGLAELVGRAYCCIYVFVYVNFQFITHVGNN
jgi:hypothetical protein